MATMTLVQNSWPSWNFTVKDSARMPWGKIIFLPRYRLIFFPCPCAHGAVNVGDQQYNISRQGMDAPFVLNGLNGDIVATAAEPRASDGMIFKSRFTIQAEDQIYLLNRPRSISFLKTVSIVGLFAGDDLVGQIEPNWLGSRAQISLPEDMPNSVMAFVIWLTVLIWQRETSEMS